MMDWGVFFSVFGLVFLAELGDKTQLAVVTQTCRCRRPWAVFAGASVALALVTALGAVGGHVLGGLFPKSIVRTAAALTFVVMGGFVAREAWQAGSDALSALATCDLGDKQTVRAGAPAWPWRAFGSTFGLLFLAELGDKTQLAVLSLASEHGAIWAVLGGGALALTAVTALGVVGGRVLCRLVPQRVLLWISAGAFIVMGALLGIGAF